MAKADINVTYTLTLSEDEAATLRDILSNIAGFPGTRREHADSIAEALDGIGMEFAEDGSDDIEGFITFLHTEV